MGVDQYASTHVFDALPDGGRIEFQYDSNDAPQIEQIRSHLREIHSAFSEGDFSTPAFVHDRDVPGTGVMAARRDHIQYRYSDLPRGGELRIVTTDPEALGAIREFMAFQRDDHRAAGMDHAGMDHEGMDHEGMDQAGRNHAGMDHSGMGEAGTSPGSMNHEGMHGQGMGRGSMHHEGMHGQGMGRGGMAQGGMAQGGMHHAGMGQGRMGQGEGSMGQGGMGHMMGGGDAAFQADMQLIHELVTNNRAITRTVEHLPNGIRTFTASSSPAVAAAIIAHVASMERRLESGEEFNLFSHTIPLLFENYERIHSEFEYRETGVAVVQTSDDPALVQALQEHAAEVTELVDEGMIAMMRGMMEARMDGRMEGGMMGEMQGRMGGMQEGGGVQGRGAMPGGQRP